MRALTLAACALLLLVLAHPAKGARIPPPYLSAFNAYVASLDATKRENAQLRMQVRKLRRANGKHGRWVRRLQASLRERIELGPSGVAQGFLCIHTREGAWNDPAPPYWGGLQMDRSFMQSYGSTFYAKLGTADHWPPFVQIAVAMTAYYSGRGYRPWSNTARYCGLL